MTQKTMISIWFWVGLVLIVYGLIIVSMGVYYVAAPEAAKAGVAHVQKSDEQLKAEQKRHAGDKTRAEELNRSAATAERLAAAATNLNQTVSNQSEPAAARIKKAAESLKGVALDLRQEASQLARPKTEPKILAGEVGGNPSLWWGLIMLAFGVLFLLVGLRDKSGAV